MQKIKQLFTIGLSLLFYPFFRLVHKKQKIILVGGHEGKLFIDNGKAMYQYLTKNQTDYHVFWIINRDSPDISKIAGQYILRGSLKNYLFYLAAEGAFFSHSASDIAPILHHLSMLHQPIKVNLEHGIIGLKKIQQSSEEKQKKAKLGPKADITVSVSNFEKNLKVTEWNLSENEVFITGIARFDHLITPNKYRKEIIYLPTWREWLVDLSEKEFLTSDFYQSIASLIENKELEAILRDTGYSFKIYIHFYFHKFISSFHYDNNIIEILPIETDIQDYLINSQFMITDYSSVAWDFFYLNKTVLFYQTDLDTYLKKRGSYLKIPDELFGPQITNEKDLINTIKKTIQQPPTIDLSLKQKYFAYHDQYNAERIFKVYQKKVVQRNNNT